MSIAIGIAALLTFWSLKLGIEKATESSLAQKTNLNQITVLPASNNFGLSKLGQNVSNLTPEIVAKIKNIPHVTKVYPQISYRGPASLEIKILGQSFITDSLIFGVPAEIIQSDLPDLSKWRTDITPLPLIAPRKILDLYNYTVAINHGPPTIDEKSLLDNEITIHLNYSSFFPGLSQEKETLQGRIVGFSDKVNLIGLSLPYEKIAQLNQALGQKEEKYHQLYVFVDQPENTELVAADIEKLNVETSYLQKEFQKFSQSFFYLKIILSLISLIILILAAISIFNTFLSLVFERTHDIGILRAIGANRFHIMNIFLSESAILGFLGGLIGLVVSLISAQAINYFALKPLANLSFKPTSIFYFPWTLIVFSLIFAVIFSLLSAFLPAYKATRLDPIEALKKT